MGSACGVGADQHRLADPAPALVDAGDLRQRLVEGFFVVGGGVGAGVTRAQHDGQGSPVPDGP